MARSRVSYNIHAQVVKNHDRLMSHLQVLNPVAVLVLDGKGLGREIKQMLPNTQVIIREYGSKGDDTIHLQMSPEQFLKERAHLAEGQQYLLYTSNEPGFDKNIIDWHVQLMELAAKQGVPLVIGNFAVGIPRPEEWSQARRMLELLDQHRDLFVLGLHEYGCGVMTSGLVGGAPNDPAHPNYILTQNWPAKATGLTQFHCGRFNFLIQYCQSVGIKPPRIMLTEHGMDDLSDIKSWSSTLKVRSGYLNVRGWKSLTDQWIEWYGGQGWSPERAYFEQLKWADQAVYQGSIVEAQCIFSWGHSSDMWEQFDIAEAAELQTLLEDYARGSTESVSVQPASFASISAPTTAAPTTPTVTTAPVSTQSSEVAPIGERTQAEVNAASTSFVAPAIAVNTNTSTTPATSNITATASFAPIALSEPITITMTYTEEELTELIAGLRTSSQLALGTSLSNSFILLADALENARGVG